MNQSIAAVDKNTVILPNLGLNGDCWVLTVSWELVILKSMAVKVKEGWPIAIQKEPLVVVYLPPISK